jgi:hypothetical protein
MSSPSSPKSATFQRSSTTPQSIREPFRQQREERKIRLNHYIEHGSDRLEDVWISQCPRAESHEVESRQLVEVIDDIRTGGPVWVNTTWGDKRVNLEENQEKIRHLYRLGCDEAVMLNRPQIKRLLDELGLDADPAAVEVQTEQPKGNAKLFYVSGLTVNGVSHPVRQRVVYHIPHVLGKARANDTKKWTPGVTLAALCLSQRNMNYVARYSGLYPIDLDDTLDVPQLRRMAIEHPCVRIVFTSVTGSGMRVCALGPVARDPDEYKKFYKRISDKLCHEWKVESKADEATYDPARLTFLPYDPEIYFQP